MHQLHFAVCCFHCDIVFFHFLCKADYAFQMLLNLFIHNICSDAAPRTDITALHQICHRLADCDAGELIFRHQFLLRRQKITSLIGSLFNFLFQDAFQLRIQRRRSRIPVNHKVHSVFLLISPYSSFSVFDCFAAR